MLSIYRLPTDRYLAVFPKAGWQSIRQSLKQRKIPGVGPPNVMQHPDVPLECFLRHPFSRLRSAWRYFTGLGGFPRTSGIGKHVAYEDFIDCVLHGHRDPHWDSQLARLPRPADRIYRFKDIDDVWPEIAPGVKLFHLNPSAGPQVPSGSWHYRKEELDEMFAEDLERWVAGA